jgi:hypothetical protein
MITTSDKWSWVALAFKILVVVALIIFSIESYRQSNRPPVLRDISKAPIVATFLVLDQNGIGVARTLITIDGVVYRSNDYGQIFVKIIPTSQSNIFFEAPQGVYLYGKLQGNRIVPKNIIENIPGYLYYCVFLIVYALSWGLRSNQSLRRFE